MNTYFIADLHLCDQQPLITRSFIKFCREQAKLAQTIYILGDLFEYWLGDDAIDKTAQLVQQELIDLKNLGVDLFFMAGNRDFLLGQKYASLCGMKILEEQTIIELYGEPVLLIHGDAQCTDDIPYQQVRSMLRNKQWQQEFLSKPIDERVEFAKNAREQSQQHTQNSQAEIMDVNPDAIKDLFATHQVKTMIHGHTHRPAIHLENGLNRIVLGDWHHQCSYLQVNHEGLHLIST